jgi:hypothetical protein
MQKYTTHFKFIRIIINDAHKENEGSLESIIIWIIRIVEKTKFENYGITMKVFVFWYTDIFKTLIYFYSIQYK